jgi:hypothetical protein
LSKVTDDVIGIESDDLGNRWLYSDGADELLFTENETNNELLFGGENRTPFVKDGINSYVVEGRPDAINPAKAGTKAAAQFVLDIPAGESRIVRLRLSDIEMARPSDAFKDFEATFDKRIAEADEFYSATIPADLSDDAKNVQRQAFAGMLWSKQYYHYVVRDWLDGDNAMPKPPRGRKDGRNSDWGHLYNADIVSMPDKWEYPWYAAWDLAFHCIPLAIIDAEFAKEQLVLMLREW